MDYSQQFTIQDENANAVDITGYQLSFGFGTETKTIATHTTGQSSNKCLTINDAVNGIFTLSLPKEVLKNLSPDTYLHDLALVDGSGNRSPIWSGLMIVKRGM